MPLPARLPLVAEVDGHAVELPADTDPLELIEALARGSWWRLFEVIDAEGALRARLSNPRDAFALSQARQLAVGVAEAVTGYRWHAACKLAATMVADWQGFDGLCAWRGFDPWSEPLARSLAMVHHCLFTGCKDEVERAYLAYELDGPDVDEAQGGSSRMAALEAATVSEWQAAFGPDGRLLRNRDITA